MPKLPGDHLFDPEKAFAATTVQAAKHHVCTLHKTILSVRRGPIITTETVHTPI